MFLRKWKLCNSAYELTSEDFADCLLVEVSYAPVNLDIEVSKNGARVMRGKHILGSILNAILVFSETF